MEKLTKKFGFKSFKNKKPAPYNQNFSDKELERLEEEFINTYLRSEVKPIRMLFRIYMRYWKELLVALVFYVIKQSPAIVLPIVTASIINYVVDPASIPISLIIFEVVLIAALFVINIPTHTLYIKYFSRVMRRVEAGLRGAMVRKLQKLSIAFHKEMQSGRIQSKLMRDVETVHTLGSQLFATIPSIFLNMVSALVVVATMNLTVLAFFVLCIPVSALTVTFFRSRMSSTNKTFRVDMENTSARLMDMVEMTEVTRAHALEDREIKKLSGNLKDMANSGLRVDIVQNLFSACSWATSSTDW
jgi:ATP-binding cassette subfamily B protein